MPPRPPQPLEGRLATLVVLALQDVFGRRAAQIPVTAVHLCQQCEVGLGVTAGEPSSLVRRRLAEACYASNIETHQALFPPV